MGRYDASYGNLLLNQGKGDFETLPNRESNLDLEGQIRDMKLIKFGEGYLIIGARNKDNLQILRINQKEKLQ